jgi:Lon protease-like protein
VTRCPTGASTSCCAGCAASRSSTSIPASPTDPAGDLKALEASRPRLLAAIGRASDGPAVLVMQNELPADAFVNALCQSLDLEPLERQSLLDCDTVSERCDRLVEILEWKAAEQAHGGGGLH